MRTRRARIWARASRGLRHPPCTGNREPRRFVLKTYRRAVNIATPRVRTFGSTALTAPKVRLIDRRRPASGSSRLTSAQKSQEASRSRRNFPTSGTRYARIMDSAVSVRREQRRPLQAQAEAYQVKELSSASPASATTRRSFATDSILASGEGENHASVRGREVRIRTRHEMLKRIDSD